MKAPELYTLDPAVLLADPGTDVAGTEETKISLTGANLLAPTNTGDQNVAILHPERLRAIVLNSAGNTVGGLDPGQPPSDITANVTLSGPLIALPDGDETVTIRLQRAGLESDPKELTIRPRFDPHMDVAAIVKSPEAALADETVTVTSPVLTAEGPGDLPAGVKLVKRLPEVELVAQITLPDGTTLDSGVLTGVPGKPVQFTLELPPGTSRMPGAPTDWTLKILRQNNVLAIGNLHLANP